MRRVAATTAILLALAVAATTVTGLNNGAGLTPPVGWSTWCSDGRCGLDYCSETTVKQSAQVLLDSGMYALGYTWVVLDDCWAAGQRTANGSITWDTERFPSGIPALTQWLHDRNMSFGLYTSMGNATCSSGGRRYPIPGSEGHYQQDANSFAAWNVDYVKADWCGDVKKLPLDGLAVGAKDYIAMSHAITNSTPARTMYLEGVAAVLFLLGDVGTYMNAWRASTDHHDDWMNTMEVVATVQVAGVQGSPGAWSDMDVLMTGGQGCKNQRDRDHKFSNNDTAHCPGMTDEEYITEFTLWNMMQSPLLVATDIRNMTSIMRRILFNERFISMNQDTRTPPGKHIGGDATCGYSFGEVACQLWARKLADGSVFVALWNAELETSAHGVNITLDFTKFAKHLPAGWGADTQVSVEDLWNPSAAPATVTGSYTSPLLAPHAINAVILKPTSTAQQEQHRHQRRPGHF